EDGIRDKLVTGVQTCALPISVRTMLELLLERLPARGIQYTWYTKQAEATITHLQVAEAAAKIDAAQLFIERAVDDIESWAKRGEIGRASCRERVESAECDRGG